MALVGLVWADLRGSRQVPRGWNDPAQRRDVWITDRTCTRFGFPGGDGSAPINGQKLPLVATAANDRLEPFISDTALAMRGSNAHEAGNAQVGGPSVNEHRELHFPFFCDLCLFYGSGSLWSDRFVRSVGRRIHL